MNIEEIVSSLWDFWISIRMAAKMMSPKATVDSPKFDDAQFQKILQNADLWLSPNSVEGFENADFSFLSNTEKNKLNDCVHYFREVAKQVPLDAPATKEQVVEARPNFQGILEVLRPDKYGDPESLIIGKAIEQQLENNLPTWVSGFRIDTGDDANGDPAVWIWVEVLDNAAKRDVIAQNYKQIQDQLEDCLRRIGVKRWPYIRIRSVSEQHS